MEKMKEEDQKAHDSILEHEIAVGFRIKDLPPELSAQLEANELPRFTGIRMSRMNPRRRRLMNEAVQRAFFRDLQDTGILSNDQIMKLVVARGEWAPEKDARVKALQQSTNAMMSQLYLDGFSEDNSEWLDNIMEHSDDVREHISKAELSDEKKDELYEVFGRWVDYTPEKQKEYTEKYAASQDKPEYSPDRDSMAVCDAVGSPEIVDSVNELEQALDKMHSYVKMTEERKELTELQTKRLSIFSDSVEGRKDNAEEMARLYFTTEVFSEGKVKGPLTPTFDELYDLPDDVIQWMLVEAYFFHNGIPDETRPYLEAFGFIRGEAKENTESTPSEESLAPPSSKPDSLDAEATESPSSESEVLTT